MMKLTSVVVSASLLGLSNAECPNACSSHGICTNYDMCQCYRNWMANDCSERVCQFGLAHVDTPKGDLDASSGALSGPTHPVIVNSQMYPYGTTEQFPNMVDSNAAVLTNTAHYYMECSNKGICDRQAGVCECFPGYEGSACQRASCPSNGEGVCSGHGTCQSIKELSNNDYNNIYELWDKSATLGCDCDAGYYGADCSLRQCKYGVDPLYVDDDLATPRYANWTYGFYTTASSSSVVSGNYSLVFYDVHGEDWHTDAIQYGDDCNTITDKLEGLPNNVIPKGSVLCLKQDVSTVYATFAPTTYYWKKVITLVFPGNPGALRQLDIDIHLDGPRPTLVSDETTSTLGTFVYANGFHGEFVDYVSDYCEGVEVTLDTSTHTLSGLTTAEKLLLKRCLGDSDGDPTNNVAAIENYDYGDSTHPHLIKLVETTAHPAVRLCNTSDLYYAANHFSDWCENFEPAGFYLPIIYNSGSDVFNYVGRVSAFSASTTFRVFTTTGRLERVNTVDTTPNYYLATNGPFSNKLAYTSGTATANAMDCETRTATAGSCLNKGDRVMFFNTGTAASNPEYHNIYTVKRVGRDRSPDTTTAITTIELDMGINFGQVATIYAYKFWPATGASYAAECSDRGVCDTSTGLCKCFRGYTSDDCSMQSTLAK